MEQAAITELDSVEKSRSETPADAAGTYALSILSYSLNARVIQAHDAGPISTRDLERTIGWAPHSSLRAALAKLCAERILDRSARTEAGSVTTELTAAGRDLLVVAEELEDWLERAPGRRLDLDAPAAVGTLRALIAGWSSTIIGRLAEHPKTLTQLSEEIDGFTYPMLERRLGRLRSTGLAAHTEGKGRGRSHTVTDWTRYAICPLSVAARWEAKHAAGRAQPAGRAEAEAAFLLAVNLIDMPSSATGECSLSVLTVPQRDEGSGEVAGVTLRFERGQITSCESGIPANPTTWGLGTAHAWLNAVIDDDLTNLRIGGAIPYLPRRIAREFHRVLFPNHTSKRVRAKFGDRKFAAGS